MKNNKYLKDFFKTKSVQDIKKEVFGELHEHSTKLASYWFGNCELIISPGDETKEEMVFYIDTIGTKDYLLQQ